MVTPNLNNIKFSIIEKPLVKTILPKLDLKQVHKPHALSFNLENEENFSFPYRRDNSSNKCNSTEKLINASSVISGMRAENIDADKLLNNSHEKNSQLPGWSAREIAQYRNEIQQNFKPETLEAIKNLKIKRLKKETNEMKMLKKIKDICNEKPEEDETIEKMEIVDDKVKDLSFLPISPNNNYINMNTLEMDKLEWMKYIDEKAEKSKLKSIRFHISGAGLPPDDEDDQEELFDKPPTEFDPFADSLHHHGEEPSRKGYTISELFWLARSGFLMQRSLAVSTLINMLNKSSNLEHVYHFNLPTVTQSLVDCGIVFLARWLIDEAGERQQHLHQALELLDAVLSNGNRVDNDEVTLNWPDYRVAFALPQLIDQAVLDKQKARLALSFSEQSKLQDDILMAEDIVTCLVTKTHFFERLSFLLVKNHLNLDERTIGLFIRIVERIARHSVEMACSVANDYEDLLMTLIDAHLFSELTECTASMLRLVRCLCQASESIAHKLTRDQRIVQCLYTLIVNTETGDDCSKIEAIRLLTVFIAREIHAGPIGTIIPSIVDQLSNQLDSECYWTSAVAHSFITSLAVFVSSMFIVSLTLYSSIESLVSVMQSKLLQCPLAPPSHHPIMGSMLHLINNFLSHQFTRHDLSTHSVATNVWKNFISVFLASPLLGQLLQKLPDSSVLGYEHHNSGHEFICLDLVNLLHNSTRLAVKTRNPKFIDFQPSFINLDPSFSVLSGICHTISLIFSTHISIRFLSDFPLFPNSNSFPHLMRFINFVAETPIDKVANVSAHSAIVQLQLEATTQLIISVVNACQWVNMPIDHLASIAIYKAAIRILPHLGPCLYHHLGADLLNKIIFNPAIIGSMEIPIDQSILELLLEFLPNIRTLYESFVPGFRQMENPKPGFIQPINSRFVPIDWFDYPFTKQCKKNVNNSEETIDLVLSEQSIVACLAFISFLEAGNIVNHKVVPITGIKRLCHLLVNNDWIDNLWQPVARLMLTNFLTQYFANISQIDISKISGLFDSLCEQYFSVSSCDSLLANLVLFPCAMRFPVKYRRTLWKNNCEKLQMIVVDLSESIIPIIEYLQPEEIDIELILYYWDVLWNDFIIESRNELLYWICIHHLNRFMFNQSLESSRTATESDPKDPICIQRKMVLAISNPEWQRKPFIKHLKLYKHFVNSTVEFYAELPDKRVQHLDKLKI